jgi:hypothetical protein
LIATFSGFVNETEVAIYRVAPPNCSVGLTLAPQNHKQVGEGAQAAAQRAWNRYNFNRQALNSI